MKTIPVEVAILEGLVKLMESPPPRVLLTPPGLEQYGDLTRFLWQEEAGYLDTEMDVARRHLKALKDEEAGMEASAEIEPEPRTGRPMRIMPPEHVGLRQQMEQLEKNLSEFESKLAALRQPDAPERIGRLLSQFIVMAPSELETWSQHHTPGIVIETGALSYGLPDTLADRLENRRPYYHLPPDRDWEAD